MRMFIVLNVYTKEDYTAKQTKKGGGLALPGRITLLATAQKQGDTASGWMRLVGPFYCSPGRVPAKQNRETPRKPRFLASIQELRCNQGSTGPF